MLQFFMGRAQAKIMFSYSRVRNLKGAKVNNVRWGGYRGVAVRGWCRASGAMIVHPQLLMHAAVRVSV